MSYCLTLSCAKPQNPPDTKFCQNCGSRLLLGDRYRAFNPIGNNLASRTFLAIDTRKLLDARCIIKQFTTGDRAAFRQEVVQLDRLSQHPQIPDLFAYFERQQQYLVQAFVEGRSLLQQVSDEGTFDESAIRQLLQEVLPLLQWIHDCQILHRDIKPANLIRCSGDQPLMLVDFGAAKHATRSAMARTGTVLGSAEYAAPEQLMGKAIVPSDLYSLGVTCIQLLTGLRPFDLFNSTDSTWIWRSVAPSISSTLAQVLDKLLQSTASHRYQSANEVLQALGLSAPTRVQVNVTSRAAATQIWQCVHTLNIHAAVNSIALSPDAVLIVGSNDPAIQVWDLQTQKPRSPLVGHKQAIATVALSPDGGILASGSRDKTIRLWNLATGRQVQSLSGHTDVVTSVAFTADRLLSGSRDKTLQLWDLSGKLLHRFTSPAAVESIAAGAGVFASGDAAGNVSIWHVETKELLRSIVHTASVQAIAISSTEATIVTGSWDMMLKVQNLNTGGVRQTLSGHLLPVATAAIDPQGQRLATGSHDRTIRLWELGTGKSVAVLTGHTATVSTVRFSADGSQIVSGSHDGTIKLWQQD